MAILDIEKRLVKCPKCGSFVAVTYKKIHDSKESIMTKKQIINEDT